ncbi:hypothetical protein B0O99DRAFT_598822 [Bisporella sp. PMI_857]|nr:hypothetical protein B0O99DRAFT_598822 [Bisporella sp. PMI_857]
MPPPFRAPVIFNGNICLCDRELWSHMQLDPLDSYKRHISTKIQMARLLCLVKMNLLVLRMSKPPSTASALPNMQWCDDPPADSAANESILEPTYVGFQTSLKNFVRQRQKPWKGKTPSQPPRECTTSQADGEDDSNMTKTCYFDLLPTEIRRQILRWALIRQHEHCIGNKLENADVNHGYTFYPPPIVKLSEYRNPRFFASKKMTAIFPVSRQWYQEIFEVAYSTFKFNICTDAIDSTSVPPGEFCLSFLPHQALQHIRNIVLLTGADQLIDRAIVAFLQHSYLEISKRLPKLQVVTIKVCYASKGDEEFIQNQDEQFFVDSLLALASIFDNIQRFTLIAFPERDDRLREDRGVPFETLVGTCRDVLEQRKQAVNALPWRV